MSSPGRPEIERALRRFIVEELTEDRYVGSDPLTSEAVDSLGLEQLVEYIEEEWGLRLEDEDLVRENFESVAVLAALVESRREAAGA